MSWGTFADQLWPFNLSGFTANFFYHRQFIYISILVVLDFVLNKWLYKQLENVQIFQLLLWKKLLVRFKKIFKISVFSNTSHTSMNPPSSHSACSYSFLFVHVSFQLFWVPSRHLLFGVLVVVLASKPVFSCSVSDVFFFFRLSQLQKITSDLDTEESFIIQAMTSLQADFNFLCELFPAVDADKLQSRLLEYCYFEGYERVHFLLLTWDKRYKEAGTFLALPFLFGLLGFPTKFVWDFGVPAPCLEQFLVFVTFSFLTVPQLSCYGKQQKILPQSLLIFWLLEKHNKPKLNILKLVSETSMLPSKSMFAIPTHKTETRFFFCSGPVSLTECFFWLGV